MRNRLTLPVRNYSAEAESPAISWKTINDNAKGIGVVFAGFSTVTGAFVYFVGNQVQHIEKQVGNVEKQVDKVDKKIDIKIDNLEKRMIDNQKDLDKKIDIKIDNLEKRMIDNQKDLEKKMADNQKELMAAINPLVVKVQVLEERFADIRNK
jgi:hypothetical protein